MANKRNIEIIQNGVKKTLTVDGKLVEVDLDDIGGSAGIEYYSANFTTDWTTTVDVALHSKHSGSDPNVELFPNTGDQIKVSKGNKNYLGYFIDGTKNAIGFVSENSKPIGIWILNYHGNEITEKPLGKVLVLSETEWNALAADEKDVGTIAYIYGATAADNRIIIVTKDGEVEIMTANKFTELVSLITANANDLKSTALKKIAPINAIDITPSNNNGGTGTGTSNSLDKFGDISDATERTNFMDSVQANEWYAFQVNGEAFLASVVRGDKTTNFILNGFRNISAGPVGATTEKVNLSVSATGVSVQEGSMTGSFSSSSVALPEAYQAAQYLPKATIEQMQIDSKSSNDFDEAYSLIANQVEKNLNGTNDVMTWRHGDKIKSTTVAIGHSISDGMTIRYFDDYNNWITIFYNTTTTQEVIVKFPERTIKADLEISKITDWDASWNGAGTPTGTDGGWKIIFKNPKNVTDDSASTFPHASTPIEMKLAALTSSGETTNVDFPKDFLINVDDILGEQSENKEMWMQFNVSDVLGNKWLSYTKGASQDIILPSHKTIYDIEGIFGFSNNKARWYNDYTGGSLPKRLSYLTLENYNIFGNETKIIVELHRADDQTTGTFTEYLNIELRPVIENGIVNVNKVNVKNAGIFSGGPASNIKALVDSVTDPNKEIANAAHIHYINIRFRGGK